MKELKYLGVYIDQHLNWEKHLEYISNKAIGSLFACKKIAGKKWGLKPKVMQWIYTTIIRPMITYASFVWYRKSSVTQLRRKVTHPKLQKVQRLALLLITGAMKTTPTDALETITNINYFIPSLYIYILIESEAIMENYRAETSELPEKKRI